MDRRSQREHIRAAQDWLGKAEYSLSRKNDVQGDLKLMLARAELSHVGHCSRSRMMLCWGRRMAALLVAAGLAFTFSQPEVRAPVPAESVAADNNVPVVSKQQNGGMEQLPAGKPQEVQQQYPGKEAESAKSTQLPKEKAPNEVKHAAAPVEQQPAASSAPSSPLPDAATQQLMQSAGKILRQ
ncbi:MAG: hypothetical protein K6F95_04170 [Selenomonas sp.]|uniref:hypothetical protein n=1 Tax=Selenomonas sp. TaxID=2053611 RepID=UPI0025DAE82A|nr:hypothetical protein [Selenomonas sp.]MCR5757083.1 hypothetical protein [Selenomonas sp.]